MPRLTLTLLVALAAFLHLGKAFNASAQNILQPDDDIIASSANSPGSEGVRNAINGTDAKYLNFDSGRDGADNGFSPSGFVVTPSVGVTHVTGLSMKSANDGPERDPRSVRLEGSNDETITSFSEGNWELIAQIDEIQAWTDLFPDGHRFQTQTFSFENDKPYRHYRWTVLETQTTPNGCCMQIADVQLLGRLLPGNVLQPDDDIIASSANSPGSEGVRNAISRTDSKYLNFDSGRDGADNGFSPSGFVVTPSIGRTLVTGISMQSANDAPERDPRAIRIEGSNDPSITSFSEGNWDLIVEIHDIPAWTDLFPEAHRFRVQTFLFDNFQPYQHYRWTVLETQTTPNGCCLQIANVELLGTGEPKNVLQPSDPIIASSANSPGSEGVANAISGTDSKYLNFDSGRDGEDNGFSPSGFVVSPSVGPTTVIGLSMKSANDAPERDPLIVTLEGSNDDEITGFHSGNWELIAQIEDIPAWTDLFPEGHRFQVQEFFFPNTTEYKHYRWTVHATQTTPNGCCMQIAEVELLAVTEQVDCDQAGFVVQPVDTPVLDGASATFFVRVNGPWPLQWFRNGEPIPGATSPTYTTVPVTAENTSDIYAVEILGCELSTEVRAVLFQPSPTKSVGINFVGSGANGAPTPMPSTDIAGIHPQAYWNNLPTASGDANTVENPDLPYQNNHPLVDSDNQTTEVTFEWATSGNWGAGTGNISPTQRMLNGLVYAGTGANPGTPARLTFHNVPAGEHAVLVYFVGIPLQFQDANYKVIGQSEHTVFTRVINADEYNAAPGFFRGTSTDPENRTLATFARFDNVRPAADGSIAVEWTTLTSGFDRGTPVNALQLVLNAPDPGAPPVITQNPQPTVMIEGGTVRLNVTATGDNLTYQWRRNGMNISDGGNVSGATTSTLTIRSFSAEDAGIYNVAIFNPAGSALSRNAAVRLSQFEIEEGLVGYWKFDETSGATAANSVAGGSPGQVRSTATWSNGRIGNALTFDGASTYVFVENYTKAQRELSASAWINVDSGSWYGPIIIQNAQGSLGIANPAEQFQFRLIMQDDSTMRLSAAIAVGPNIARVTETAEFPLGSWQHVAFSADGAQLRLYRNGNLVGSTDYSAAINQPEIPWLSIGAMLNPDEFSGELAPDWTNPEYLQGSLDDLGLWIRGLSADEVTKIFEAGQQGQPLTSVELEPPPIIGGGDPGTLQVTFSAGNITISWDEGTLQSAPTVLGPWNVVTGESPHTEAAGDAAKFYRAVSE
jgi:soluble cytochrome b562